MRPRTLWLAQPSRYATLSPARARWVFAALALLLLASLTSLAAPGPPPVSGDPAARAQDQADVILYETIVDGVRHGGDYYVVAADALRSGDYPLRPFVTFRLPALAIIQSLAPAWAALALLWMLAATVLVAWALRLAPALSRVPPLVIALALLSGGLTVFVQPDLIYFHEIWAGLLVALSLALRQRGRSVEAIALGLAAILIRETAALYIVVMAVAAFIEGERREAAGWAGTLAVLAAAVACHAVAVAAVVRPLDPASPGWHGMLGFGFFVRTMAISTPLALAPLWLGALLVALSLVGWGAWREPLAARALALFAVYALLIGVFGRVDTFYWGLIVAPTLLVGLAFVPDGLRDLTRAALDRRRITVTRSAR